MSEDQNKPKEEKTKEEKTKKKRPSFHMMLFVDSNDGTIKQMGIGQRVIEVTLAVITALLIIFAIGWGVSAYHAHVADVDRQALTEKNDKLTKDNDALNETNDELEQKISALSNTVNIKTKTENQEKAADESAREPSGFPLSSSAATPESSDNDMVIYTASSGTNVIASGDGTVADISPDTDYGNVITIDHGDGYKSMYYNAGDPMVKKGDKVVRGSVLFTVGDSNTKLGYQISKDGTNVDPMTLTKIDG